MAYPLMTLRKRLLLIAAGQALGAILYWLFTGKSPLVVIALGFVLSVGVLLWPKRAA